MTGLLSPGHIVILLIVLLLVFGAKRLPEVGRSLGHGMREFKDSVGGAKPPEIALPATEPTVTTQSPVAAGHGDSVPQPVHAVPSGPRQSPVVTPAAPAADR